MKTSTINHKNVHKDRQQAHRYVNFSLVLIVLISLSSTAFCSTTTHPLRADPKVTTGSLENGLTYYIQRNAKPEKHVELRLVVKAGSIDEDEDQKGAAHFVEHLAFDGSKNFPNKTLVDSLRSIGVEFGNDLNASTFHNRTIYKLPIPNNTQEDLRIAFTVLKDWMQDLSFPESEIDKERAVLKEETRLRRNGAERRIFDRLLPHMLGHSKYLKHEPSAAFESIDNITPAALMRYYRQWYRPDNMAIIIVGDIEVKQALNLVRDHFKDIPKPRSALNRRKPLTVGFKQNTAFAFQDDELTQEKFLLFGAPNEYTRTTTEEDLRDNLIFDIFQQMINKRLTSLVRKSDPPFAGSVFSDFDYLPNHSWRYLAVVPNHKGPWSALQSLWREVVRINQFGFTQAELDYQKKNTAADLKKQLGEIANIESPTIVENMIESYLYGDTLLSASQLLKYQTQILTSITLNDFKSRAKKFFNEQTKLTTAFLQNTKDEASKLDSTSILQRSKEFRNSKQQLQRWVQETSRTKLMERPPIPGYIVEETGPDEFAISKFKLSNGIEVWHKETEFKANEVKFLMRKQGGTALASDDQYFSARYAASMLYSLGLADLDQTQVTEVLAGKQYQLDVTTGDYDLTFAATSTTGDLEAALQELYLRITSPHADQTLFNAGMKNLEKQIADYQVSPEIQFYNLQNKIIFGDHPRTPRFLSADELRKFSLDQMLHNYKINVDNFNGAKATFVGNIKRKKLKELIVTYLATLPSKSTPPDMGKIHLEPRKGEYIEEIEIGYDNRALVNISLFGDSTYSRLSRTQFYMLNDVLKIRINKILREKLGLIYSESIDPDFTRKPKEGFWINIVLPCAPENANKVVDAIRHELKNLREELILEEEISQVKKKYQAEHDTNIKSNSEWADRTLEAAEYNTSVAEFIYAPNRFLSVTATQLRDAARQYYSLENMITLIRRPKPTPSRDDKTTGSHP